MRLKPESTVHVIFFSKHRLYYTDTVPIIALLDDLGRNLITVCIKS